MPVLYSAQPDTARDPVPGPRSPVPPPLSLYIHIPWCVRKCPYCDFNSHGLRAPLPVREYVAALLADLDGDLADFGEALGSRGIDRRPLESIFFGGGTPSLMPPDAIAAILDGVAKRLPLPGNCEVTLETNPGTVEHGRFDGYRNAGVNRISFGVQSFDDGKLRALGRIHSAAEAETAVKLAQDAGFDNINLDLMYALPDQQMEEALADVERAIALDPAHISHYQLTLEPGTPFARRPPTLPGHDAAWDMQEACEKGLADAGYAQYEVSAYARPGRRCRHNVNYWEFGDYLGIGAGAHGKITGPGIQDEAERLRDAGGIAREAERPRQVRRGPGCLASAGRARLATGPGEAQPGYAVRRRWKTRSPLAYLQHAGTPRRIGGDEVVAAEQLPFEFMLNALRLHSGVIADEFVARTGLPLSAIDRSLGEARTRGWLTGDPARLQTTAPGRRFLNDVLELFLPEPDAERAHA
ncbi:MAG TPA: radical SAM family heme chaperone HemW [Rhodanobacteraceae bacterium]|nr:radical SAM family heme chaperone HemW [Rhodanobacteraceae bacterium]